MIFVVYIRSTRVSNEKGGGDLEAAKIAVWAVTFIGVIEGVVVSIVEFSCRHVLGEAYSNDKQVVEYVADMTPLHGQVTRSAFWFVIYC